MKNKGENNTLLIVLWVKNDYTPNAHFITNLGQRFQWYPNISKLNSSITKGLAINEEKSLETNTIHLAISNCIPDKTINCPSYYIIIDEKGHFKIKQTNHAWT